MPAVTCFIAGAQLVLVYAGEFSAAQMPQLVSLGSALSLGPMLLIFGLAPRFGIDPHHGNWFIAIIPLLVLFPLTLAYVVVVQRAMEVHILLRMGTRYVLAKATLVILQASVVFFVLLRFVMPLFQGRRHSVWEWLASIALVPILLRFVLMPNSPWSPPAERRSPILS